MISKKLSKKGAVALSVLIAVLIILAVYFSITLIRQVGADSPTDPSLIFQKSGDIRISSPDGSDIGLLDDPIYDDQASLDRYCFERGFESALSWYGYSYSCPEWGAYYKWEGGPAWAHIYTQICHYTEWVICVGSLGVAYNVSKIGSDGVMEIYGNVCELAEKILSPPPPDPITPDGDDFVIRDSSGNVVAMIDNLGYVWLKGKIYPNQASITEGTGNFLIKNGGTVVGKIDQNGDLFLRGSLTQASVPIPGDNCCAVGENWVSDEGSCGIQCWYTCVHSCDGSGGTCRPSCAPDQYDIGSAGCPAKCCCWDPCFM
jgi:hypothetical protein